MSSSPATILPLEPNRREAEGRLAAAVKHLPIVVATCDRELRYTWIANARGIYSDRDVIGRRDDELLAPGAADELMALKWEVLESEQGERREVAMPLPTGTLNLDVTAEPLRDEGGAVVGLTIAAMDITARKRAETAIRSSEEQARWLAAQQHALASLTLRLDSLRDLAAVLDLATDEARRLIGAHQAVGRLFATADRNVEVTSYSTSETIRYWRATGELDRGQAPEVLLKVDFRTCEQPTRERGRISVPLCRPGGGRVGVIALADKFQGEFSPEDESILVQLARIASMVIENTRLYAELRDNDRRKNEFLAMLAHELRNPLAAIANAVEVTVPVADLPEAVDWGLGVVRRQVGHLTCLIDDLLDVARINQGKIELKVRRLNLAAVFRGAVEVVTPLVTARRHALDVLPGPEALWVEADPVRLEQVLVNLLTNAIKYTDEGGQITLSAAREADQVVIKLCDNGMGIPPESLHRMFDLFAQGDRALSRSEGGLGIGLTLVKRLVSMHHGTVTAASGGVGLGSEFAVRLPAAAPPPAEPRPGTASARSAKLVPARILVVDDSRDNATAMHRLLQRAGHEVAIAFDGPAGIALAKDRPPDVILLDIGLPGMDGYEVAEHLRDHNHRPRPLLIALTGYAQQRDRQRSQAAGFDHHLVKPVDFPKLLQLINEEMVARARFEA